ncbi:hypothetical protein Slin_3658 [Spirosoma linguale DSM 74]|uniref:Uncharacterized protein n=1 Tax=Spirosoma linguale (strain ATCC 33905 / DSM 74 / LMG 10896 / Claus 1) TaxID=504472 RepID=D2QRB0_SPILD|nr:hypothetical protein Slin_3658 [Spirosoma linguale DSM 74]
MSEGEKKLLASREEQRIGETEFYKSFPLKRYSEITHITSEIDKAIAEKDSVALDLLTYLVLHYLPSDSRYVELLNELLLASYHHKHQEVAKRLQKLKSPCRVVLPFRTKTVTWGYSTLVRSDVNRSADAGQPSPKRIFHE